MSASAASCSFPGAPPAGLLSLGSETGSREGCALCCLEEGWPLSSRLSSKRKTANQGSSSTGRGPGGSAAPGIPPEGATATRARGEKSFLEHGARGCSGHSRPSRGCRESTWGPKVNNCSFRVLFLRAQETGVCPVPLAVGCAETPWDRPPLFLLESEAPWALPHIRRPGYA